MNNSAQQDTQAKNTTSSAPVVAKPQEDTSSVELVITPLPNSTIDSQTILTKNSIFTLLAYFIKEKDWTGIDLQLENIRNFKDVSADIKQTITDNLISALKSGLDAERVFEGFSRILPKFNHIFRGCIKDFLEAGNITKALELRTILFKGGVPCKSLESAFNTVGKKLINDSTKTSELFQAYRYSKRDINPVEAKYVVKTLLERGQISKATCLSKRWEIKDLTREYISAGELSARNSRMHYALEAYKIVAHNEVADANLDFTLLDQSEKFLRRVIEAKQDDLSLKRLKRQFKEKDIIASIQLTAKLAPENHCIDIFTDFLQAGLNPEHIFEALHTRLSELKKNEPAIEALTLKTAEKVIALIEKVGHDKAQDLAPFDNLQFPNKTAFSQHTMLEISSQYYSKFSDIVTIHQKANLLLAALKLSDYELTGLFYEKFKSGDLNKFLIRNYPDLDILKLTGASPERLLDLSKKVISNHKLPLEIVLEQLGQSFSPDALEQLTSALRERAIKEFEILSGELQQSYQERQLKNGVWRSSGNHLNWYFRAKLLHALLVFSETRPNGKEMRLFESVSRHLASSACSRWNKRQDDTIMLAHYLVSYAQEQHRVIPISRETIAEAKHRIPKIK